MDSQLCLGPRPERGPRDSQEGPARRAKGPERRPGGLWGSGGGRGGNQRNSYIEAPLRFFLRIYGLREGKLGLAETLADALYRDRRTSLRRQKKNVIPTFTASGALPPFVGDDATERAQCSPYRAELSHVRAAFAHTREREALLRGLLDYRAALRAAGITQGFQLIDGSFTEDCENVRGRPPSDIDLVTFGTLPVPVHERSRFLAANMPLFNPENTKQAYSCDAYFVDLQKPSHLLVADTTYWFGLFSHQRVTALWKGLIQVPLVSDDDAVRLAMDAAGAW